MAKNRAEWASGHRQLTRIGLSDGCGGELIPVAVQSGYHRNKFEGHLGNVGLEDKEGLGPEATSGDTVVYNVRIFLIRGEEVLINEASVDRGIPDDLIRREDGHIFVDHVSTLGKRQTIAGIEKTLIGMRTGGFRKLRVSPHLAFRDRGVPGLIPPDAVLNISVWIREIR